MSEFNVVFTVAPAVRIEDPIQYDFLSQGERIARVAVSALTDRDALGKEFQTGLVVHAIVIADDIEQAVSEARVFSEGILSVMSFCSGVGIPLLKTELAYDSTPDIDERPFIQHFDIPHSSVSRGKLESEPMAQIREALDRVDDEKVSGRLGRAIRWYRKAAMETDSIDRFSYYWLSLESLNSVLEKHYGAEKFKHTCPKCGYELEYQGLSGVRALLDQEFDEGGEKFRLLRNLRVAIQHETRSIEEMYSKAVRLLPLVRNATVTGVLELLGLKELRSTLLTREITNAVPVRIMIPAVIHGRDSSHLGPPGEDPHLEPLDFSESIRIGENGLPATTGQAKFNIRTAKDVKMVVGEFGISGEGLSLKSAEIED